VTTLTKDQLDAITEAKCSYMLVALQLCAKDRGLLFEFTSDSTRYVHIGRVRVSVSPMYASSVPGRPEAGRITVSVEGLWKPEGLTRAIRSKAFTEPIDPRKSINVGNVLDRVQEVIACRDALEVGL